LEPTSGHLRMLATMNTCSTHTSISISISISKHNLNLLQARHPPSAPAMGVSPAAGVKSSAMSGRPCASSASTVIGK
jgi:hypothetical protein